MVQLARLTNRGNRNNKNFTLLENLIFFSQVNVNSQEVSRFFELQTQLSKVQLL
jgi:hypothetical protein